MSKLIRQLLRIWRGKRRPDDSPCEHPQGNADALMWPEEITPDANKPSEESLDFSDFGGERYRFPESCTDLHGLHGHVPCRTHGRYQLVGNAFQDLPAILKRIDEATASESMAVERRLIHNELQRLVDELTLYPVTGCAEAPVPALRHTILKVEKFSLEMDVCALEDELRLLRRERDELLVQLNEYRAGALVGRTAHAVALRVADALHDQVRQLIDSHPYYDGEIELANSKRVDVAALRMAFQSKRSLARASAAEILAIPNVGPATLSRIVETFNADGMPSVAALGIPDFNEEYGHWRSVAAINSNPVYRWRLPRFIMGEGFHVIRSTPGLSYLRAVRDEDEGGPKSATGS